MRPRLLRGSGPSRSSLGTAADHSPRKIAFQDQTTWQQHVAERLHPDQVPPASLGCFAPTCPAERSNPILRSTLQELSQPDSDQWLSRNFAGAGCQQGNQPHSHASSERKPGPRECWRQPFQLARETVRRIKDRGAPSAKRLASFDEIPTQLLLWEAAVAAGHQARKGTCLQRSGQPTRPTQKLRENKSREPFEASLLLGSWPNTRRSRD